MSEFASTPYVVSPSLLLQGLYKDQVNLLYVRWNGSHVLDEQRDRLHPWRVQQQSGRLAFALAFDGELDLLLLRLAKLVHPCTDGLHLESCGSEAGVDRRLCDARLEVIYRAVAIP